MEENELTKLAVAEIIREMGERKLQDSRPRERKLNPLGKANKRFLGRTINSIITHNQRADDRTFRNCQRKLRELDNKPRHRWPDHDSNTAHCLSEDSHVLVRSSSSSSSSSSVSFVVERRRKHKKCKHKKKKSKSGCRRSRSRKGRSRRSRRSRSSRSVSTRSRSSGKCDQPAESNDHNEGFYDVPDYLADPALVANNVMMAAAAYSQMNQHFQAALSAAATENPELDAQLDEFKATELQDLDYIELKPTLKCERISISDSDSESSSSSSGNGESDVDENNILTINLNSDDDDPTAARRTITPLPQRGKIQSVDCISLDATDTSPETIQDEDDIQIVDSSPSSQPPSPVHPIEEHKPDLVESAKSELPAQETDSPHENTLVALPSEDPIDLTDD